MANIKADQRILLSIFYLKHLSTAWYTALERSQKGNRLPSLSGVALNIRCWYFNNELQTARNIREA